MLAVKVDRPPQALFEPDSGLPARQLAQLGGVYPLPVDLAGRHARAADIRLDLVPGQATDQIDDLADPVRLAAAGVERLPRPAAAQQRPPDRQVGGGRVLDVQEVALW